MNALVRVWIGHRKKTTEATESGLRPRIEDATFMDKMPQNALLIAFGFPVQYRALRCADLVGMNVFLLGTRGAAPLRYSRFCRDFIIMDDIQGKRDDELPRVQQYIETAIAKHRIEIVIPADPDAIWLLTRLRSRLSVPVFPIPGFDTFNRVDDKWTFRDICLELGVPTPKSWLFLDKAEILSAARNGELPEHMIIKPTRLAGQIGVLAVDRSELTRKIHEIDYSPMIVQEFIPGVDYHCTIVTLGGKPLARLTYIDLPDAKHFGCESDILTLCEKIAAKLKLDGIFNFDTRRSSNGDIYFLECNPRPFLSMHMCAQAGINCIQIGIEGMLNSNVRPTAMGVKALNKWRGLVGKIPAPWKISRSDRGRIADTLSDPIPALHEVSEYACKRLSDKAPWLPNHIMTAIIGAGLAVLGSGVRAFARIRTRRGTISGEFPNGPTFDALRD